MKVVLAERIVCSLGSGVLNQDRRSFRVFRDVQGHICGSLYHHNKTTPNTKLEGTPI